MANQKKVGKIVLGLLTGLCFASWVSSCETNLPSASTQTINQYQTIGPAVIIPISISPTPTLTIPPMPTLSNTPEPFRLGGTIFYSDYAGIYAVALQELENKVINGSDPGVTNKSFGFFTVLENGYIFFRKDDLVTFQSDIYRENIDGSNITRLTYLNHVNHFAVAPDGKHLVYSIGEISNYAPIKLYLMNLSNGGTELIKQENGLDFTGLEWSPDGSELAITEFSGEKIDPYKLFIFKLANQKVAELLPNSEITSQNVSWDTDGKKLTVGLASNGQPGIYSYDTSMNTTNLLAATDDYPDHIAWSPDEKMILFDTNSYHHIEYERNTPIELCLLDLENQKTTIIQKGSNRYEVGGYHGLWSPDGASISYYSYDNSFALNLYRIADDRRLQVEILLSSDDYLEQSVWVTNSLTQ
jgi:WD40 repeat protein